VKLIITWKDGRVGIQIFNFYRLPFTFSKIQTPHIERCWMDGHITLTWLKKVVTRLIDPCIVLVFSPSPTFVSINVTLTNWRCLLVLICKLAHVSFEKASTTLVMCFYLFIWVQMYVLEDQTLKCSLPSSMDPFFFKEMWVGLSIIKSRSNFLNSSKLSISFHFIYLFILIPMGELPIGMCTLLCTPPPLLYIWAPPPFNLHFFVKVQV
jgi:hypothetical protein